MEKLKALTKMWLKEHRQKGYHTQEYNSFSAEPISSLETGKQLR